MKAGEYMYWRNLCGGENDGRQRGRTLRLERVQSAAAPCSCKHVATQRITRNQRSLPRQHQPLRCQLRIDPYGTQHTRDAFASDGRVRLWRQRRRRPFALFVGRVDSSGVRAAHTQSHMSSAAACRAARGRKGRGSVTHMLRRRARLPGGDDSATVGRREGEEGLLLLNRSGVV
jgi:hypothetical protein